jgi:hypothetical protein
MWPSQPADGSTGTKRNWAQVDQAETMPMQTSVPGAVDQSHSRSRTSGHAQRPTFVFASTIAAATPGSIGNAGTNWGGSTGADRQGAGSGAGTGLNRAPGSSSPRRLTQREKNREAVRKCRLRKKLHAQELNERAVQLEEENAKLRMQLQLGNEEVRRERSEQGENLLKDIEKLVASSPSAEADVQLRKCVNLYVERHHDNGRDRQSAIGYILSRLKRLLQPTRTTKMYLWQMSHEQDSFFGQSDSKASEASSSSSKGSSIEAGRNVAAGTEWAQLCQELELTKEQEAMLMHRRRHARLLRSEFAYADDVLNGVLGLIRDNKR